MIPHTLLLLHFLVFEESKSPVQSLGSFGSAKPGCEPRHLGPKLVLLLLGHKPSWVQLQHLLPAWRLDLSGGAGRGEEEGWRDWVKGLCRRLEDAGLITPRIASAGPKAGSATAMITPYCNCLQVCLLLLLTPLGGGWWVVISPSVCPWNWTELSQQQPSDTPRQNFSQFLVSLLLRPWNCGMLLWSWVGSQVFCLWKGNLPRVWRDDRDLKCKGDDCWSRDMEKSSPAFPAALLPPSVLCALVAVLARDKASFLCRRCLCSYPCHTCRLMCTHTCCRWGSATNKFRDNTTINEWNKFFSVL